MSVAMINYRDLAQQSYIELMLQSRDFPQQYAATPELKATSYSLSFAKALCQIVKNNFKAIAEKSLINISKNDFQCNLIPEVKSNLLRLSNDMPSTAKRIWADGIEQQSKINAFNTTIGYDQALAMFEQLPNDLIKIADKFYNADNQ